MTVGWSKMAIFTRYVVISRIRCILKRKLLQDANSKPHASYRMVSHSMTMKIKWVLWRFRCSTNDRKLLASSLVSAYAQKQTSGNLNCHKRHDKRYRPTSHFVLQARVLSVLLSFLVV